MTDVKYFHPENRLARLIKLPGGITIADAMADASQRLEASKDKYAALIDAKVIAVDELVDRHRDSPSPELVRDIYWLANELFCEAGACGQKELSEAAHSLCDLTVNQSEAHPTAHEPLRVHADAMKLLRGAAGDNAAMRAAIVKGLKTVSAKAAVVS